VTARPQPVDVSEAPRGSRLGANTARRHRILWVEVCDDGTTGGTHQMLLDLARNLDRSRFELVALFYQTNRFIPILRSLGIEVIDYSAEWMAERAPHKTRSRVKKIRSALAAPIARARLLRKHAIDLLYLVNTPAAGFDDWMPAARIVRIPSVACCSGPYVPPRGRFRRWLTRQHYSFVSLSNFVTQTMTGQGLPGERIHLIPPGADLDELRRRATRSPADVRAELGADADRVLVLMVGNIRHWKGQDIVLAALERLPPERRRRLRVAFAGAPSVVDAQYVAGLNETVQRVGLEDVVTFLGTRTDVPDLLKAADIVVHASRVPEPFGIVVVEGMAMGKPVIATGFGGPAEVLIGNSGRLFDPEHPEELAQLLDELASNPEVRAAIGRAALERVKTFDARQATRALEEVYSEALGRRASSTT
jgi:glycosyltransferase involved in cell wall biosynthesis